MSDKWLGEVCKRCGHRNTVGWEVADDIWLAVVGDPGTIRCLTCFDEEAEAKGVVYRLLTTPNHISWDQWEADVPCDPPNACATHGRCWTHSEWANTAGDSPLTGSGIRRLCERCLRPYVSVFKHTGLCDTCRQEQERLANSMSDGMHRPPPTFKAQQELIDEALKDVKPTLKGPFNYNPCENALYHPKKNLVPCKQCDGTGTMVTQYSVSTAKNPCRNCAGTGKVDPDGPTVNQQGLIVHEVGLTVNGERVDIHLRHLQWHVHLGDLVVLVTMSHEGQLFVTPANDVPLSPEDLLTVRRGVAADLSACLSMVNLRYALDYVRGEE